MATIVQYITWAFLLGILTGLIARAKGYSFWTYWLFGVILFIVALPWVVFMKSNNYKLCEYCSEKIKKDARICKHCHKELSDTKQEAKSNKSSTLCPSCGKNPFSIDGKLWLDTKCTKCGKIIPENLREYITD